MKIAIPVPPETDYANYFETIRLLGGEAERVTAEVDPDGYDGLLLPGGGDVDPARYGQPMNGSLDPDPVLDELQWTALKRFDRAGKPVFGICRGHQLINVYFGGTLIQHLDSAPLHTKDTNQTQDRIHRTIAEKNSWICKLYGEEFITNSSHHQGVDRPGKGLIIDQRSEDGVVEGMHHENGRVFSVQWHPERMCFQHRRNDTVNGDRILSWFLQLCAKAK